MDNASFRELLGRVTAIEAAVATLIEVSPAGDQVREMLRRQSREIAEMVRASAGKEADPILRGWDTSLALFLKENGG
ncbi:hypothetical protein L3067_04240 [Xanthomonas sp. PPL568]|uniref:hypothetical protein n=1 Tax=Xanthomonas indica TaxID=2912242 RepID=UPI001F562D5F|nr:hypothetical protein [Xanthomonas indica]MCI2243817.1 hypothetical protein [Xanthomonas indica]